MTARQLDQDLIDHACSQLHKVARRHVNAGTGPATAARAAIRETKTLFPPDWRLTVQGDDVDEYVEVWEVEHKRTYPCARVSRDVDLPLRATKKTKTAKSTKSKRRAYDINPSSPDVIKAFMRSGYPVDEVGIQEFIAKHYGDWMRQYRKRLDPRAGDPDPAEIWTGIIDEFTEALRKHFHFEDQ